MNAVLLLVLVLVPTFTLAQQAPDPSPWRFHADLDAIRQYHGDFASAYQMTSDAGGNSFRANRESGYSLVLGASLGYRISGDSEFWFREESIRGIALSNAGGLAGLTDNDMQRNMINEFKDYRALAFLRSKWDLGGANAPIEEDAQQFAQAATSRRLTVTAGNVDLLALFDDNRWAHKGADRFINWCFMTHCAYDFAADARGYTWGAGGELDWDGWSARAGRYAMPELPNQLPLDYRLRTHFGDNLELERRWEGGSLKLLAYRNRMPLSTYASTFNIAPLDLNYTGPNRRVDRTKVGTGINLEQAVGRSTGIFARLMSTHGDGETMAFTEADRSVSTGIVSLGDAWGRPNDNLGIGYAAQFASADRQAYLGRGLLALFIGDGPAPGGQFHYGPEQIVEAYYLLGYSQDDSLTFDWQHIVNPAYNRDRGPIEVYGLRLHLAY